MGSSSYISAVSDALGEAPGDNVGAKHGPGPGPPGGSSGTTSFLVVTSIVAVGALAWRYWPYSLFWLETVGVLVMAAACLVDVRERRVPNVLVGSAFLGFVLVFGVAALVTGQPSRLLGAGAGAIAFVVPLLGSHLWSKRHLPGLGDVKLAGVLGLLVGAVHPLLAGYGLVLGLLFGVAHGLLRRLRGARGAFAFAPALCLGAMVVLVVGPWWLVRLGVAPM